MAPEETLISSNESYFEFWARYLRMVFEARDSSEQKAYWLLVYELRDAPVRDPSGFTWNPLRMMLEDLG